MARKRHSSKKKHHHLKSCSKEKLKTALQRAHGKHARGKILGTWAANCTRSGKHRKKKKD